MATIALTLTREQVETNCLAIDQNSFSNLEVDGSGTLVSQGWISWTVNKIFSIDESKQIREVVLKTLAEINAQMKENPPICFFVKLGWISNSQHPYSDIAVKVLSSRDFQGDRVV